MVKYIPNTITSLNLVFGTLAVLLAVKGQIEMAAYAVFMAAIMDFLDGFAARLLKAYSEVGKELDSLADLVSFGVAPSIIVWMIIRQSDESMMAGQVNILEYLVILMPVFAALRLAKFNVDDSQETSFSGLPVPGNAIFFAGLALNWALYQDASGLSGWLTESTGNAYILSGLVVVFSILMVIPLRLFSLKFNGFSFKTNSVRYIFLLLSLLLILLLGVAAIPLCIVLYLALAVVVSLF